MSTKTYHDNPRLLELTNKFLNDFYKICKDEFNDDKSFAYNCILPHILTQSDIPLYKENVSCLIPMSSFESNYIKDITNIYLKDFPKNLKIVLEAIQKTDSNKLSTDGCIIDNYKQKTEKVESFDMDFIDGKWISSKILVDEYVTTFDISNTRNEFEGTITIHERDEMCFIDDNDKQGHTEKIIKDILFKMGKECVFSIRTDERFNKLESTLHNFTKIKDINSFFYLITFF